MLKAKIWQEQGMKQNEISSRLGVSDRTVRNYLKSPNAPRNRKKRISKLAPYRETVAALIGDNPHYNGELLYEQLVKAGYTGKISILRDMVCQMRRKVLTDAVVRYETIPGLQAQVDWKEFGNQSVGGRRVKLYAFVMVLGYSRSPFICFTTSMKSDELLRCHLDAFRYFGGVPAEILYDNMKTAFIADESGTFHVHKDLLQFAAHYGFEPKRCRVRRPQTKGKVERTIGYVQTSFWPRVAGCDYSIEELNANALQWVDSILDRRIGGMNESRLERFAVEKPALKDLPMIDLDIRRSVTCTVNRESCIVFETNKYSLPPDFIGRNVSLHIDEKRRTAEVVCDMTTLRMLALDVPGARAVRMYDEDSIAINERHRADMKKTLRIMKQSRKSKCAVAVEVRHPSIYDAVIAGGSQ